MSNLIVINNARVIFRNFSGVGRPPYNQEGDRNFSVVLDPESADKLEAMGLNVRRRPPRDPDGEEQCLLRVSVSYKKKPPKIIVIDGHNRYTLGEDSVGNLDFEEFENVDISINPYHWQMPNGASGIKAYLNSMYVTLVSDPLADKYAEGTEGSEVDPF